MKNKIYLYLSGFIVFILLVGVACSAGSATPAPIPSSVATAAATGNQQPSTGTDSTNTGNSSASITFTDKNNLYAIDLPGDWKHTNGSGTHYYFDRFASPDQNGFVENVAYDDGTPFTGSQNGQFALQLLNQFYSSTGQAGDIHVSDDSIQKDGSERLTWYSSGGGYSGVSFFEVRNSTTFLMFTVWYNNDFKSTYFDVLDKVISSYRTP
jgi:hypothetical protein